MIFRGQFSNTALKNLKMFIHPINFYCSWKMQKKKCTFGKLACFERNTVFPDTLLLLRQKWKAFKIWQIVLAKNERGSQCLKIITQKSLISNFHTNCYESFISKWFSNIVRRKRRKSIELTRILVKWVVFFSSSSSSSAAFTN